MWVVLALVVAVALIVALAVIRRRGRNKASDRDATKVDAFRRHMDALSPEARRGVIDRVRAARDGDAKG